MICTEKEAAEKWCPHARRSTDNGANYVVTPGGGSLFPTCIGSRCMQWRWKDSTEQQLDLDQRPPGDGWIDRGHFPFTPEGFHRWYRELTDDMRRGYCGLAGKS